MMRTQFAAPLSGVSDGLLHVHRTLIRIALSGSQVFAWIFVFQHFYFTSGDPGRATAALLIVYAFSHAITFIITPVAASVLRQGTKRGIMFGALFASSAFLILGSYIAGPPPGIRPEWLLLIFALLLGFYRALYFVPYRTALNERGGKTSGMLAEILIAIVPAGAGVLLSFGQGGALALLYGASALIFLSLFPLTFASDTYERFSWKYGRTYHELFRKENRRVLIDSLVQGVQGAALLMLWPLAIFIIIGTSYRVFGAILAITALAVLLFRMLFLSWHPVRWLHQSRFFHGVLGLSGWVLRLSAATPTTFIIADVYSHVSAPNTGRGLDIAANEQSADGGRYIDEYTALKEMGNALGRIALALGVVALLFYLSLMSTLLVAFIVSAIVGALATFFVRA